jgi:hypothetical protein
MIKYLKGKLETIKKTIIFYTTYYSKEKTSILEKACFTKEISKQPKLIHSYENEDADGNRGIWVDYIQCPTCGCDLYNEDECINRCPECNQLLDWDMPSEYDLWED